MLLVSAAEREEWDNVVMSRPFDLEDFVRAAGDAIIAAGPDGSIVVESRGGAHLRYSENETPGKVIDVIISERFRDRHREGYGG